MAVILASRDPRKPVFLGVVTALAAMTILSVGIGRFLMLLPQLFSQYLPSSLGFLTYISIDRLAAASKDAIGVMLGGIVGHTICALIAVIGGRAIASHISERTITIIGGLLFILLAIVSVAFTGK